MTLLEVQKLTVRYGAVTAVEEISISVGRGELVGMVGPNGAGKSSTLAAIAGTIKPHRGEIHLDGESIVARKPEDRARRGLGLVPEGRHIFTTLSVAENLRLGFVGRPAGDDHGAALERELDRFPVLRRYYHKGAGKLSGGEQQQLAIARALLGSPRLLMTDEPSLGLAPLIVDQVFDTLTQLRDEGVTVLLVEQNAARTVLLSDRTYVLRNGRIVAEGTADDLDVEELTSHYLGRAT